MALQAQLTASLIAAPASVSDQQFPSGTVNLTFGLNPNPKQYNVAFGGALNLVNSSFTAIPGIGAAGEVTQVTTLYVRTAVPMKLQLTMADPDGGADIVSIVPVNGVLLLEFPSNGYVKALSVKGSGQFEFWAAGLV